MTRDPAYFPGNPHSRIPGPQVLPLPVPFPKEIPFIGPILFQHNITVYASLAVIAVALVIFGGWNPSRTGCITGPG